MECSGDVLRLWLCICLVVVSSAGMAVEEQLAPRNADWTREREVNDWIALSCGHGGWADHGFNWRTTPVTHCSILSGEPVRVVIDQGRVGWIRGGGCSSNEMIEQRRNKLNTRCSHVPPWILAWPPWDTLKQSWEYCLIDSADVLPGAMTELIPGM